MKKRTFRLWTLFAFSLLSVALYLNFVSKTDDTVPVAVPHLASVKNTHSAIHRQQSLPEKAISSVDQDTSIEK